MKKKKDEEKNLKVQAIIDELLNREAADCYYDANLLPQGLRHALGKRFTAVFEVNGKEFKNGMPSNAVSALIACFGEYTKDGALIPNTAVKNKLHWTDRRGLSVASDKDLYEVVESILDLKDGYDLDSQVPIKFAIRIFRAINSVFLTPRDMDYINDVLDVLNISFVDVIRLLICMISPEDILQGRTRI